MLRLYLDSLSYSTALTLNAGTDNVYLICVFIRFISYLLRKVKYCGSVFESQKCISFIIRKLIYVVFFPVMFFFFHFLYIHKYLCIYDLV